MEQRLTFSIACEETNQKNGIPDKETNFMTPSKDTSFNELIFKSTKRHEVFKVTAQERIVKL